MTIHLNAALSTARDLAAGINASARTLASKTKATVRSIPSQTQEAVSKIGKKASETITAVREIGADVLSTKWQDAQLNTLVDSSRPAAAGPTDLNGISANATKRIRECRDDYILADMPKGIVGKGLTTMTDRLQGLIKNDGEKTLVKSATNAAAIFNIKGIEYSNKAGQVAASLVHLLRFPLSIITCITKDPAIADGIATGLAAITRAIVTLAGLAIVAAVDAAVAVTASTLALAGAVTVLSIAVATSPFWASAAVVYKLLSDKINVLNSNVTDLRDQLAAEAAEEAAQPTFFQTVGAFFEEMHQGTAE